MRRPDGSYDLADADDIRALDHNLTNHPPRADEVIDRMVTIRDAAKNLGVLIIECAPRSRERSLALTNLEQTVMWAIAAVARNQGDDSDD